MDEPIPYVPEVKTQPASGSIWPGGNSQNLIFSDRKARSVNDVVTILVDENATGANNAKTETNRDTTTTAGIAGITQATPDNTILSKYELGGASSNSLKGEGKTRRDSSLTAKVTARVIRVLGNGNLVIEGRRLLAVNAEDQYMVITGLIRPEDITSDNTIASQYISDARITYSGKGVVDDKMRPGWLTRVVDWVWPF
jgi:flagellar L-ring protein FlgH